MGPVLSHNGEPLEDAVLVRRLFDAAAPGYARLVAPWLSLLAADFVTFARPRPDDLALDVGAGTGAAAHLLVERVGAAAALDLSPAMLRQAESVQSLFPVSGDLLRAPFARQSFALVIASFGLNTTHPDQSLPALRHLIAPGGRLAIQEWGPVTALDAALDDLLVEAVVEEPPPPLAALRTWMGNDDLRWQNRLQDPDDYREWLEDFGFMVEDTTESAPVSVRFPSADAYATFWEASPGHHAEISALSPTARDELLSAAREVITTSAAPDGAVIWQPAVLRALAHRAD